PSTEGSILVGVHLQRGALDRTPLGVEGEQLICHLTDPGRRLLLGPLERLSAQAIEARARLRARVALDLIEAVHGQKELVLAGVLDDQEIEAHSAHLSMFEPEVATDPMLSLHDEVADLEGS